MAREIGDQAAESSALSNLGGVYADLGDSSRAIEFYERGLVIAREIGDRSLEGNALGEGAVLGSLGVAHKNLGERPLAIERHEQALTIAREIGDRYREGDALGNLGLAYAALGEPSRAIDFLRGALEIFEAIESPHAAQARATIAKLEEEGGT